MITYVNNDQNEIALVAIPGEAWFISEFKKYGYTLAFGVNDDGNPLANATSRPKNRKMPKVEFHFAFVSRVSRARYLIDRLEKEAAWARIKAGQYQRNQELLRAKREANK